MSDGPQGTPLERLEKRLYSTEPEQSPFAASSSSAATHPSVPTGGTPPPPPPPQVAKPKLPLSTLFFLFACGFFVIAVCLAAWVLFFGGRSVSTDHIQLTVQGPTSVAGGDGVPLLISVKNDNPVALTDTSLMIDFPDGTFSGDETDEPLTHYVDSLGDVPAGTTVVRTVRARLFGNAGDHITIPIMLEYRTPNSTAIFQKKTEYDLTIGTSPVSINVQSLTQVSSGQPLTFVVSVRSNSATPLPDVSVVGQYPPGFSVTKTEPAATNGNLFKIGTLVAGEEKKITVTGTLTAQDNEERVFHFSVGTQSGTSDALGAIFTKTDVPLTVSRPFLATDLSLNRSEEDPVIVPSGTPVQAAVSWENTLSTQIRDGEVTVALSGNALDPESIQSSGGFYRSADTSVVFGSDQDRSLASLQPGDRGTGSFTFSSKTGDALAALRNPTIKLTVSVAGRRVGEAGVADDLGSTLTRTVRIASDFLIASRIVRTVGPFTNTGPWPPTPNSETTYTVILSATNNVNSVADGAATMTLPSYVRFMGKVNGSVTYDESTRVVTWDVGDVTAGTVRDAAFQIAFTPSTSQGGASPILVGDQTLLGYDRFVSRQVKSVAPALDTRATTDPAYQFSYGAVQR